MSHDDCDDEDEGGFITCMGVYSSELSRLLKSLRREDE